MKGRAGWQGSGIWRGSRCGTWHTCVSENPPSINSECWIDCEEEVRIPEHRILGCTFLAKADFNKDQSEIRKISSSKPVMLLMS